MTTAVLITICTLLLAAYLFDVSAARTRIPTVILLLLLGWGLRQATDGLEVDIPNLAPVLPLLGTIGLIMIVLEGSLELNLEREKLPMIGKASLMACLPLFVIAFGLAVAAHLILEVSLRDALTNAIPLAIISSAIAIPTAQAFSAADRQFVIYESSISDIIGVLLFNFVTLHEVFDGHTFASFGLQLVMILAISVVATLGLAFLLSRIRHHIKFGPIVVIIVLIYAIAKVYHLPGLITIMVLGLFLGNLDRLTHWKWVNRLHPEVLEAEVARFHELVIEGAFLVRSLFFLLFGYQIETAELLDPGALAWALGITSGIFLVRLVFLKLMRVALRPLFFIAPRGLVTVLLFLSIPAERSLPAFGQSLVLQVVLLSAGVMMVGTILGYPAKPGVIEPMVTAEAEPEAGQD